MMTHKILHSTALHYLPQIQLLKMLLEAHGDENPIQLCRKEIQEKKNSTEEKKSISTPKKKMCHQKKVDGRS